MNCYFYRCLSELTNVQDHWNKWLWLRNDTRNIVTLECGPMPNVMAALPNIGGTLCSTPQSLVDAHYHSAVQ